MAHTNVRLTWNGAKVAAQTMQIAREGLFETAEELLQRANQDVPLDTGILQASGQTHITGNPPPDNSPLTGTSPRTGETKTVQRPPLETVQRPLAASVFYNTPYALSVHESTTMQPQGGRKTKWLETAARKYQAAFRSYMRQKLGIP